MVGINMKMPKDCKKCPLMGTDGTPTDYFKPMMCVAIWATKHEIKHCIDGRILDDCPLVEIEERKVGKWVLLDECANSGYYCSECHKKLVKEGWSNTVKKINYCPNCGSKISDIPTGSD